MKKLLITAELRDLEKQVSLGEISYSRMLEIINEKSAKQARDFAEWIDEQAYVRDPFPRKGFNDDKLRYTNIATIDHHSDDKLECYTIEGLWDKYTKQTQ